MSGLLLEECTCKDLLSIAINDDAETLEKLLETCCLANGTFWLSKGILPQILSRFPPVLCLFAFFGATNCIDKLIQNGSMIEDKDLDERNIAHFAFCCRVTKRMNSFIRTLNKEMFTEKDQNGLYPIHYAAMFGRKQNIKRMLKHFDESYLLLESNEMETPLEIAIKYRQNETADFIISKIGKYINENKEKLFASSVLYGNMTYVKHFGELLTDEQKKGSSLVLNSIKSKSLECFSYIQQFNNEYNEYVLIKAMETGCFDIVKMILKNIDYVTPHSLTYAYLNCNIIYLKILTAYSEPSLLSKVINFSDEEPTPFIYDKVNLLLRKKWKIDSDFLFDCCASFSQIFPLLFKLKIHFDIQKIFPEIIKCVAENDLDERFIDLFFNNGAKFTPELLNELSEQICNNVDYMPVLEYIDTGHWIDFGSNDDLDKIGLLNCTMSAPFLNFIFQFTPNIPYTDDYVDSLTYKMLYKTTRESFVILLDHQCIDMQFDTEENSYVEILFDQNRIFEAEQLIRKYDCFLSKELIEKNMMLERSVEDESKFLVEKFIEFKPNIDKNYVLKNALYSFDDLWKTVFPLLKGMDCMNVAVVETFSPKFSNKAKMRLETIGFDADKILPDGNKMSEIFKEKKIGLSPKRTQTYISQSQSQLRSLSQYHSQAPSPIKNRNWQRFENYNSNLIIGF